MIDELLAAGLEVVLDVHHFDAVHDDAAGQAGVLDGLWRQLAARYPARPPALALELLNEPRAPMTPGEWNELAAVALAAVRAAHASRRVVLGPAEANTLAAISELHVPDDDRLLLTIHYYEPFRFTHQGASWEPGAREWLGTGWGSNADRATVRRPRARSRMGAAP